MTIDPNNLPYDIEPGWALQSGKSPRLFCQGCEAEISNGEGQFPNGNHSVLDCLKELRDKTRQLQHQIDALKEAANG